MNDIPEKTLFEKLKNFGDKVEQMLKSDKIERIIIRILLIILLLIASAKLVMTAIQG